MGQGTMTQAGSSWWAVKAEVWTEVIDMMGHCGKSSKAKDQTNVDTRDACCEGALARTLSIHKFIL